MTQCVGKFLLPPQNTDLLCQDTESGWDSPTLENHYKKQLSSKEEAKLRARRKEAKVEDVSMKQTWVLTGHETLWGLLNYEVCVSFPKADDDMADKRRNSINTPDKNKYVNVAKYY